MISDEALSDLRSMSVGLTTYAPMSSGVLARFADEIEAGGPVSGVVDGHPDAAAPLFGLRALAGVRWLVLNGRAPELFEHLLGLTAGIGDPEYAERTWQLFRQALLSHPGEIRAALDRPVQQHQPGRASLLLTGLAMLQAPRVRLLEIGACAGLNLLVDKYRWFGPGWEWGDPDSPVRLAASGPSPGAVEIVDRAGCDLAPRNAADPADAMILQSFLPHERDIEQLELDEAIALAGRYGLEVEQADAVEWLADQLDPRKANRSVCTVVWHSLFWGYLDARQQADVERLLTHAAQSTRVARVGFEPHDWSTASRLQVTVYS
ncbi:DUF2332 domain-containing protein [Streptomyces sp. NPDC057717]|uniref:DUF2332 domain-containing protein n=1 Tax=Streptomyces sp. NPDC057717 TaxID=3346224 RepID=UPI0036B207F4